MHSPFRLLETGSIEVKVLFILADQVFLFFLVITGFLRQKQFKIGNN